MGRNNMALKFLVGDIGGTKTELALTSDGIIFERTEIFQSMNHQSLEEIITSFLVRDEVLGACFGIAGPVKGGVCSTTNLPWIIDAKKINKQFGFSKTLIINDLEATAYGVKILAPDKRYTLWQGQKDTKCNQAIISPGTGLGEALVIYNDGKMIPVASEGGHSDFAPRNNNEIDLFQYLKGKYGRVSCERVLSGNGLSDIYSFLSKGIKKQPGEISKEALASELSVDRKAVRWFCEILGAEAGNLVLSSCALGGVFIGGGIAPKILEIIKEEDFLIGFFDKGRFSNYLKKVSVQVILDFQVNMRGAAFFFLNQQKDEFS